MWPLNPSNALSPHYSLALSRADVGIAMKVGAGIARAADIVLMERIYGRSSCSERLTRSDRFIGQNFMIIAGLNTLAYALAIPRGLINPGITTLVSKGSEILATLNAIRPVMRD